MKTVEIKLSRDIDMLRVDALGDFHIGDEYTNIKDIKKTINKIKEDKNRYCVLNGDLMNNAITTSVSDTYKETMSPEKQLDFLTELLMPIKDKILVLTSGNHENRTSRAVDMSPLKELGYRLNLINRDEKKNRFMPDGGVLFLRVGEIKGKKATNKNKLRQICYSFYVGHGSGGGRKIGGKVNRLEDLKLIVDVDIYIHSHTHQAVIFPGIGLRLDTRNNSVQEIDKLYVNTGSYLNYGGYGQHKGYTPLSRRSPTIVLNGTKKEFDAYTLDMSVLK
jgi:predicted phosphodiesterase